MIELMIALGVIIAAVILEGVKIWILAVIIEYLIKDIKEKEE